MSRSEILPSISRCRGECSGGPGLSTALEHIRTRTGVLHSGSIRTNRTIPQTAAQSLTIPGGPALTTQISVVVMGQVPVPSSDAASLREVRTLSLEPSGLTGQPGTQCPVLVPAPLVSRAFARWQNCSPLEWWLSRLTCSGAGRGLEAPLLGVVLSSGSSGSLSSELPARGQRMHLAAPQKCGPVSSVL